MAIAYFDSNAFVKLVVNEDDSDIAARLWNEADAVVASRLAYPEVCATLARARREERLTARAENVARRNWEEFWEATRPVELTARVEALAGDLARELALRGADAVHLASAMAFDKSEIVVVTWDRRLRRGVTESGLNIAPLAPAHEVG